MNQNKKVLRFVVFSVVIYFFISLAGTLLKIEWAPFNNINLVGELFSKENKEIVNPLPEKQPTNIPAEKRPARDATFFHKPGYITNFTTDTIQPTLDRLIKNLYEHKTGKKKRKIRIAYFGDSMIEGDLIVGTFRELMQQEFGGTGVGFVPVKSVSAGFRQTVTARSSGSWTESSFKSDKVPGNLYLSGHLFKSNIGSFEMRNNVNTDTNAVIEKYLLCGFQNESLTITVNSTSKSINTASDFNRVLLGTDGNNSISVGIPSASMPVYGLSFEGENGVVVDNYSFRGISGVEYAKIDSDFLLAIQEQQQYDLLIFQYGVNLLFRPKDKDYSWYKRLFFPVIEKFKSSFPGTDILIVSTADRAFRYGTEYKTAIGINSLISEQADIAFKNNTCFYNLYETMGGENSITKWASQKPPLANKDYIHFNHKGAFVVGEYLFHAVKNEYKKYEQLQKTQVNKN
jgi:lysophospholipase L1-like esterase